MQAYIYVWQLAILKNILTYLHASIHICLAAGYIKEYTYLLKCKHTYMHECISTRREARNKYINTYKHICLYIQERMHAHISACDLPFKRLCIHTGIHTCMHSCTCVYLHKKFYPSERGQTDRLT